jgi:hypothetical protein
MQKNYSITSNYIIRTTKIPHDNCDFKDEYQNEVYLHATKLCQDYKYTTVTDIGCGSGYKLNKYFLQYDTIGYEIEPCYSYLQSKYPNKRWKFSEFKNKLIDSDLIICADHPNFLINLYVQILLIEQNCTLIHASAYQAKSGKINIFTGAGGAGKTAILGHAVSQMGLKYLGDDLVIINLNKECLSFPRHFVLKKYHSQIYSKTFSESKIYNFNFSYLKRFLHENLPFVGIIKTLLKKIGFY